MTTNISLLTEVEEKEDEGDSTLQNSWLQGQRIYAVLSSTSQSM